MDSGSQGLGYNRQAIWIPEYQYHPLVVAFSTCHQTLSKIFARTLPLFFAEKATLMLLFLDFYPADASGSDCNGLLFIPIHRPAPWMLGACRCPSPGPLPFIWSRLNGKTEWAHYRRASYRQRRVCFSIKAFALLIPVGILSRGKKGKEKKRETHK